MDKGGSGFRWLSHDAEVRQVPFPPMTAACHFPGRSSKLAGVDQRLVELSTLEVAGSSRAPPISDEYALEAKLPGELAQARTFPWPQGCGKPPAKAGFSPMANDPQ